MYKLPSLRIRFFGAVVRKHFVARAKYIMTTSTSLSGGMAKPTAPQRGSFPLDHLSECRQFAREYRKCLERNSGQSCACRRQAREYLNCRMQRGLMAPDDWRNLGLSHDSFDENQSGDHEHPQDAEPANVPHPQNHPPHGKPAFVAGIKTARARQKRTESQTPS